MPPSLDVLVGLPLLLFSLTSQPLLDVGTARNMAVGLLAFAGMSCTQKNVVLAGDTISRRTKTTVSNVAEQLFHADAERLVASKIPASNSMQKKFHSLA